jgi:cytochrome c
MTDYPAAIPMFAIQQLRCPKCRARMKLARTSPGPTGFELKRFDCSECDHASAGFAKADFAWDDARLDAWLANPEAIIPGAIVAYRQPQAETRAAIIAYLKELN